MKYFTVLLVILVIAMILTHKKHPRRPFFQSWQSSYDACENVCNNSGQNYVKVLQYSYGGCLCDNEEGRKMQCGYLKEINPGKEVKVEQDGYCR
jgi:hypothetical protein